MSNDAPITFAEDSAADCDRELNAVSRLKYRGAIPARSARCSLALQRATNLMPKALRWLVKPLSRLDQEHLYLCHRSETRAAFVPRAFDLSLARVEKALRKKAIKLRIW